MASKNLVLSAVDDMAIWLFWSDPADGRGKRFVSIEDASDSQEYLLGFTSQRSAERCFAILEKNKSFNLSGTKIGCIGGRKPEQFLDLLEDPRLPPWILWDWDGHSLTDMLVTPRSILRRAKLGWEKIWERPKKLGPAGPII